MCDQEGCEVLRVLSDETVYVVWISRLLLLLLQLVVNVVQCDGAYRSTAFTSETSPCKAVPAIFEYSAVCFTFPALTGAENLLRKC